MGFQRKDENKGALGQAFEKAQSEAWEKAATPPPPSGGAPRRVSLSKVTSQFSGPYSRHQRGEVLGEYLEAFKRLVDKSKGVDGDAGKYTLIPLDKNNTGMALSYLLVTFDHSEGGVDYRSVFTLILEGSFEGHPSSDNPNLLPVVSRELYPGKNINLQLVAGDVQGSELWQVIESVLRSTNPNKRLVDAGSMTVPHEVVPNPEDPSNLTRIWFFATQATKNALEQEGINFLIPFSVDDVDTENDQVMARRSLASHTGGVTLSAAEIPIRSDVRISLEAGSGNNHQPNPLQRNDKVELSIVDAFVDVVYEPATPQVNNTGWLSSGGQQQVVANEAAATVRYRPRIVMTNVDTQFDAVTLEFQLMALASSTLLMFNDDWTRTFVPDANVTGMDFRDIGAVGYEVNLTGDPSQGPAAIPTKGSDFQSPGGNENAYTSTLKLLQMVMHREPILSMDIDESGELSWIQDVFMEAASGTPRAIEVIFEAANNLTGNRFSAIYQGGPILHDDKMRIPMGYYRKGEVYRDIRDVDYLAVLNACGPSGNLDPVVRYSELMENTAIPMDQRTSELLDIIRDTVGSSVRVTGYARRYTFNPNFLLAIMEGLSQAGLKFNAQNMIYDAAPTSVRGMHSHANMAFNTQQASQYFQYGPTNAPGGNFINRAPSTRFNRHGGGGSF